MELNADFLKGNTQKNKNLKEIFTCHSFKRFGVLLFIKY